jgi:hypothetical protein
LRFDIGRSSGPPVPLSIEQPFDFFPWRGKKPKEVESEEELASWFLLTDTGETILIPDRPKVTLGVEHYNSRTRSLTVAARVGHSIGSRCRPVR